MEKIRTIGYIACAPEDGDRASDHDGTICPTYERALLDRCPERPAVRSVGSDGYLYVDDPETD